MFYVVYIDVLFLVNFFMDFVVLTAAGAVLGIRAGFLRKALGAAVGAGCYCITLLLPWEGRMYAGMAIWLLSACIMGRLVFSLRRGREVCRFLLIFYASAFFLGGAVTTVYNHTRLGYYIRKAVKGDFYAQLITGILAGIVLLACILGKVTLACIRQRQRERELYYEVELSRGNKTKKAMALLDTGNHLREPISRKPVILMDRTVSGELLERELEQAVSEFYATGELGRTGEEIPRLRLVPYHSVGRSHGLLAAVLLDRVTIRMGNRLIEAEEVYAAVTEEPVSSKGEYQVLLNAELVRLQGE